MLTIVQVFHPPPPPVVKVLLTELQALLSPLPHALPIVIPSEFSYRFLIRFTPDSVLVQNMSEVSATNSALKHMLRH